MSVKLSKLLLFCFIYYTFRKYESEYIEYSEVDNHDDFYSIEEGRIHVLDQRGYYIIYDAAEDDLK